MLEGYFPDQPQRRTYVQLEESRSSLTVEADKGPAPDEQADVPLAHAQALLAVSHGQAEYVRTKLFISCRLRHLTGASGHRVIHDQKRFCRAWVQRVIHRLRSWT